MATDMLTLQEEEFVDHKVKNYGLSKLIAYLLWFFVGVFGGHRYYTGRIKSGIAMTLLYIVGFGTIWLSMATTIFSAMETDSRLSQTDNCVQASRYNREEACTQYREQARNSTRQHPISFPKGKIIFGVCILAMMWLWWLIDAFFLAGIVNRKNEALWNQYAADVLKRRQNKSAL